MRKLTQREQKIMTVTMALVVIFVGYKGILKPFDNHIKRTRRSSQAKQAELKRQLRLLESMDGIGQKYDEYRQRFQQGATDEQIMSSVIREIENIANQHDLRLSDLKPARVSQDGQIKSFPLAIQIEGDFHTIIEFLHTLQQDPYLYKVDRLNLTRRGNKPGLSLGADIVLSKIYISL